MQIQLRHYLQLPWLSQPLALPELNFTAHSMKATLLSWALQVPGITEADRLRQGHHRRGSAELYSRDDVLGQLRTQSAVRDAIRSGVHFSIPLHRGGQRPIQPIQVPNETFCKAASEQPWGFFEFSGFDLGESWVQANSEPDTHAEGPEPAVTDAHSCKGQSAASGSHQAPMLGPRLWSNPASEVDTDSNKSGAAPLRLQDDMPDEVLLGSSTRVLHVLIASDESSGVPLSGAFVKAACGACLNPRRLEIHHGLTSSHRLCRRAACVLAISRAT